MALQLIGRAKISLKVYLCGITFSFPPWHLRKGVGMWRQADNSEKRKERAEERDMVAPAQMDVFHLGFVKLPSWAVWHTSSKLTLIEASIAMYWWLHCTVFNNHPQALGSLRLASMAEHTTYFTNTDKTYLYLMLSLSAGWQMATADLRCLSGQRVNS